MSIVQAYTSTAEKSEGDIEEFYGTLGAIMTNIKKANVLMGDGQR